MSLREEFAENIVKVLRDMQDPKPVLVTRDPFDVEKLAISQFPAILVNTGNELREDISMAVSRRGFINYTIRGFVRGSQGNLDQLKNEFIERIEETLDSDRYRGNTSNRAITTQVTQINVIQRIPPLGEIEMLVTVRYKYSKGVN
jgi:hypothetical protein